MIINKKKIKLFNTYYYIQVGTYDNNRLSIHLVNKNEKHNITLNLKDEYIEDGRVFLDPLIKDNGVLKELIKLKIIREVCSVINYNYVDIPIATFNIGILRKYDPEGVEKHFQIRSNNRSYNEA